MANALGEKEANLLRPLVICDLDITHIIIHVYVAFLPVTGPVVPVRDPEG